VFTKAELVQKFLKQLLWTRYTNNRSVEQSNYENNGQSKWSQRHIFSRTDDDSSVYRNVYDMSLASLALAVVRNNNS